MKRISWFLIVDVALAERTGRLNTPTGATTAQNYTGLENKIEEE